ncbi:MAG: hypothetical protein ACPG49_04585 [Chitinophagales bacterium]
MKTATVKQLKEELNNRTPKELLQLCLRLSKFKKENKELLTYLLFESTDEASYIEGVKTEIDEAFGQINTKNYYLINKGIRKILRKTKTYIRYSLNKETEVELLIYFCQKIQKFPSTNSSNLRNLYYRQIAFIKKKVSALHEDLQYDYGVELQGLELAY